MKLERTQIQKLELFLERIKNDTYPEPPTKLHSQVTQQMFHVCLKQISLPPAAKILDVGCGQGVALEIFQKHGFTPIGITLNTEDVAICQQKGYEVYQMDQSFLEFPDNYFDFVWCRHCLEHSIFPYFTLQEISRVIKPEGYLYIEVPAPDTSCKHQTNRNHYSVLGKSMWLDLIKRSGFETLKVLDINFNVPAGPDVYWAMIHQKSSSNIISENDIKTISIKWQSNSKNQEIKLSLDSNKFTQKLMLECFKKGQTYESEIFELLCRFLRTNDCFIDIGAHIGYYSILAAKIVGNKGKVFAFEPELSNYQKILENINLNSLNNIKLFNMAVGSETKETQIFVNQDNDGGHALWDVGQHPFNYKSLHNQTMQNTQLSKLDNILSQAGDITNLKMIKIDTEGAELNVIKGAVNTISQYNVPYIICEINRFGLERMGTNETELRKFMNFLDYETYLLTSNSSNSLVKLPVGKYHKTSHVFNVLFKKESRE
ncbi:FkbM family methyltransferase [Okeania sp.]|uniref:FkbM family methyltransferase n=1 Tax=Okeania sp. TaxID=3100323 RepID=UPI002B4AD0DF|nr:FkbM family methyltransferase [Okeania sp.]MEB3343708.1 FkbM family methyltransferase [Okeania sp.]